MTTPTPPSSRVGTPEVNVPYRSVKDYGAVGDGVTDDTAAIVAAIAAMNVTQPGALYLPASTYLVSSTITLPSGAGGMLIGDGQQSIIAAANGLNATVLVVPGGYWTLRSFGIAGNLANQTTGHGISVTGTHCWIDSVYVDSAKVDGILLGGSTQSHKLTNVIVTASGSLGIEIAANVTDCELIGCFVGTSNSHNIQVGAGATRLTNCHAWGSVTGNGVHVPSSIHHVQLVNCDLETNAGRGLRWNSGNQGCSISGGRIWRNVSNGIFGFAVLNCSVVGVEIVENGFGTGGAPGIVLDSAFDCSIVGCQFFDNQGTKTQTYAVQTLNTADRQMFHGNSMRAAQLKTGSTSLVGAGNLPAVIGTNNTV